MQLLTVQQHILEEQRRHHPQASGEFSWLLSGITLATKIVAAQVRRAGLAGILGVTRETNVQGETVQKLDVIANQTLLQFLGNRGNVAIMASEENDDPVIVERDRKHGKYVVVFDPLDGSSNIDVNVSVGTIFSILRRDPDPTGTRDVLADVLQPGYRAGRRRLRRLWQLDDARLFGRQRRARLHARSVDRRVSDEPRKHAMPPHGYGLFRATRPTPTAFRRPIRDFSHHLRSGAAGRTYSSRYIGSLVADFHRTLLKGGIFLYPPTKSHPARQTAAALRSQPDRLPGRTSRRPGHRWHGSASSTSSPTRSTSARR